MVTYRQPLLWEVLGPVFSFKTDPEYAHHVFHQLALEYAGDSQASAQLLALE